MKKKSVSMTPQSRFFFFSLTSEFCRILTCEVDTRLPILSSTDFRDAIVQQIICIFDVDLWSVTLAVGLT